MPTTIEDLRVTLRDLLRTSWAPSNSDGVTPEFITGWVNPESARPQLTISGLRQIALRGGSSGYAALDAGGAGPIKLVQDQVDLNAWAHHEAEHADGSPTNVNPKQQVYSLMQEADRIITANAVLLDGRLSTALVDAIEQPPDLTRRPAVFRYAGMVISTWRRTPE